MKFDIDDKKNFLLREFIHRNRVVFHLLFNRNEFDIFVTDHWSSAFLVKLLTNKKCMYYVHYLEQLKSTGFVHTIYNSLWMKARDYTIKSVDYLVFNSNWTSNNF